MIVQCFMWLPRLGENRRLVQPGGNIAKTLLANSEKTYVSVNVPIRLPGLEG